VAGSYVSVLPPDGFLSLQLINPPLQLPDFSLHFHAHVDIDLLIIFYALNLAV
jgi:hypothetical protein